MEPKMNKTVSIIRYVLGLLGFLGVLLAILTVTGVVDRYLTTINYGELDTTTTLIVVLLSSILGILFLFIAFTKEIDKFFTVLETKEIKLNKKDEHKGISIESVLFVIVAIILLVFAIMLAMGRLVLRTELPFIGENFHIYLIVALVILAILALFTAFNRIVMQSVKEMKKVHWPNKKEMKDYSAKVFAFIIFFSVFFLLLDLLIGNFIKIFS